MSLKAYLAERYMSGPKADAILAKTGKKKKRKATTSTATTSASAAFIKDDDAGFGAGPEGEDGEEDDVMKEAVVASDRSFKKRKVEGEPDSGWTTVREREKEKEEKEREEDKPLVVDAQGREEVSAQVTGGLVTAAQLRKQRAPKEPSKLKAGEAEDEEAKLAQETVYRDASGRRIDVKAERAEAARKKREREEREARKMEWGKGLVQRGEAEKMKEEMEKMRGRDLARYADDKELNERLREQERWEDPMAAFLTKKRGKGPKKPEYNGPPPPPNRFGIRPGYRWDGVDRSNGFEKKLFQRINEKKRTRLESYQWSVDDM
ncbi:hypothetical protein GLOTRDRAFT_64772 [Gloeophyllum trabeum ATCC 11539]|uniref:Pre-mRNA-splicing factor CWC26 n=1 Tax=Gloeophyllum trabeum (strain ATCC 11539 / FP-39264 / Madison 617) TaxID=670483 RepID=S7PWP6_GLOTA|nr:uncharacterized protein GLOTRDRAFT_64772 [Gloeophyllum trabeum ATCC 11539]EPQ52036.1 hypothetical protein GLOTRDRAFT_64772 [Gloeophyllum trabeum ATCC 11539]